MLEESVLERITWWTFSHGKGSTYRPSPSFKVKYNFTVENYLILDFYLSDSVLILFYYNR